MQEIAYLKGPRILEDGTNLDADIVSSHPSIAYRQISDPVSDGSLGTSGYEPSQKNKDGGQL